MKKDTIVKFVCFATELEFDEFFSVWEKLSKKLVIKENGLLQQAIALQDKTKYKYILQYVSTDDFEFSFIKRKTRENLTENRARTMAAGGYALMENISRNNAATDDVKVMAFINPDETDLSFYHRQTYRYLNVYEAYFENCTYSYVLEFYLPEKDAPLLVEQLKTKAGIETAIYKECPCTILLN